MGTGLSQLLLSSRSVCDHLPQRTSVRPAKAGGHFPLSDPLPASWTRSTRGITGYRGGSRAVMGVMSTLMLEGLSERQLCKHSSSTSKSKLLNLPF